VEFLEERLGGIKREEADQVVVEICNVLTDRPGSVRVGRATLQACPQALVRFTPLVYAHVRPEEDVEHEGVYTPGPRDHAQRIRSELLTWLTNEPPEKTHVFLLQLADNPCLRPYRDWILHRADEQARRHSPWLIDAALEWSSTFSRIPRSDGDLFRIALDRIDDIRLFVEADDRSARTTFAHVTLERPFQIWLASELDRRSIHQYSVPREEEIDRGRKPDIRLHSPACGGPVGIEVKVAERWSGSDLEKALRQQLVGEYLRSANARYGILLLCSAGQAKTWVTSAGERLSFLQLVNHLQVVADQLVETYEAVNGLRVVGIDFHEP